MKHTFAEKSFLTFLGMATLMSVASFLFIQCHNKEKLAAVKSQKKKPIAKVVENNKRVIYLTFDDGPNKGTEHMISIAHKRKVPVTSFIIGKHVFGSKKQLEIFEKMKSDTLVELSNHSYSHANNHYTAFYENSFLVVHDFNLAQDTLQIKNKNIRTPGRNIWRLATINDTDIKSSKKTADELSNAGYKLVGWDLEWKPSNTMKLKGSHREMLKKVDSIFFNDLEKTSRHLVFLTHDQYLCDENSRLELDLFIMKLQQTNKFEFKKISEYPNIYKTLN